MRKGTRRSDGQTGRGAEPPRRSCQFEGLIKATPSHVPENSKATATLECDLVRSQASARANWWALLSRRAPSPRCLAGLNLDSTPVNDSAQAGNPLLSNGSRHAPTAFHDLNSVKIESPAFWRITDMHVAAKRMRTLAAPGSLALVGSSASRACER